VQSRLIDDLLDLTRIARGKLDLDQQPVSVLTLLRDSAAIVAGDLSASAQTLKLDLELPADCHVIGDAARLQQVFWNLLKNSTKFSPPGAQIHLRASLVPADQAPSGAVTDDPRHRRVVIQVVDQGAGIAQDDLHRIFRPFEQVASRKTRDGRAGLGLGLSIARAITELHDGSIHVRSDGLGAGATFTVELPLAATRAGFEAALPTSPGKVRSSAAPTSGPWRVLLVEDHGDTGAVMARILRRNGYEVVHATTAAAAIATWQQGGFHVLISDIGLPDGSGFDVMRQICAHSSGSIPGICMSGYGMEVDLAQSRTAGFNEHLIKPVSTQQLLAALGRVVATIAPLRGGVPER
jgi:CheY-like chemotaxis protein